MSEYGIAEYGADAEVHLKNYGEVAEWKGGKTALATGDFLRSIMIEGACEVGGIFEIGDLRLRIHKHAAEDLWQVRQVDDDHYHD